jgi:hypothetical protein
MPIDWGSREMVFRLLAAAFAVIGKERVSKIAPSYILGLQRTLLLLSKSAPEPQCGRFS